MDIAFGVASYPTIALLCYGVAEMVKRFNIDTKYIPAICPILGAILGVISYYTMGSFPAENTMDAIAIGLVSGGFATWADQFDKNLIPKKSNDDMEGD